MAKPKKRITEPKTKPKTKPKPKAKAKPVGGVWPTNEIYDSACMLITSDPQTAATKLKAALKLQPERPRIHINLAWALSNLGHHADAKKSAERAFELEPSDPYIAARRVHVLFAAKDEGVIEAARHAMRVPNLLPEDRRYAHAAICWTLMRTSPQQAVYETEKLVAEWPDHAEELAAHACALSNVSRWDEGLVWIDKAIAADPSNTRVAERKGTIAAARDAAIAVMTSAREEAERDPQNADRWRELGLALYRYARPEEALEAFARAHEIEPVTKKNQKKPLVISALMAEATARTDILVRRPTPTLAP